MHECYEIAGAIEPGVLARNAHGADVDIGCQHALPQSARGGDGENASAGADVENPPRRLPAQFTNMVEREETAARRAVMAGAEGERRFDFDADATERHAAA